MTSCIPLPAHIAAKVFTDFDLNLGEHFTDVYHPPVKVLFAAYKKKQH
ncbi:MAG: hypothetical protein IPN18_08095 [Ignavibacteriales bacterium]|nr:hypothetical protein [Ignavibacteriales bacterium]